MPDVLRDGIARRIDAIAGRSALPSLDGARCFSLDGAGNGNLLVLCRGAPRLVTTRIVLDRGARDNLFVLGPGNRSPHRLHFQASGALAVFAGGHPWQIAIDARFSSSGETLLLGHGATSNGTSIVIEGDGRSVVIGEDAMLAARTSLRTSDLHAITGAGGSWLNPPADVVVGDHVWIGEDAAVQKGVTIGAGAILGARALATRDIPARALALGLPARVIREDIEWTRERMPVSATSRALGPDVAFASN